MVTMVDVVMNVIPVMDKYVFCCLSNILITTIADTVFLYSHFACVQLAGSWTLTGKHVFHKILIQIQSIQSVRMDTYSTAVMPVLISMNVTSKN
jgi:hypothetical protein